EARRLDGVADAEAWDLAARAWSALSVPERVAHARYREAEARLTRGESRRAVEELLREAHRTASGIGAAPLLAEIEALARRGRISVETIAADQEPSLTGDVAPTAARGPGASTPADPHGLTARELEVLGFLVAGRTNREIGAALYISPKTAGVHVSNILGKLGAVNRVEAASIAHRLGLLED
ncbi:MAG TPA: LuxR C-terminal-related transcriptional regulator, partial [Candidatus Limnocylindrales bacterium]|nr:LuxR C-terminal-related transcriptional regulator [Candidatus Limnocylindrales bacterium]